MTTYLHNQQQKAINTLLKAASSASAGGGGQSIAMLQPTRTALLEQSLAQQDVAMRGKVRMRTATAAASAVQ